jgi:hypothetical protein
MRAGTPGRLGWWHPDRDLDPGCGDRASSAALRRARRAGIGAARNVWRLGLPYCRYRNPGLAQIVDRYLPPAGSNDPR